MSIVGFLFFVQTILFSFLWAVSTSAEIISPNLFGWVFGNGDNNITQLATCSSNLISIISSNGTTPPMGVPPYYMISYAVDQMPVTSYIGWGENNLTFTVTQPPGSQLLLSVVDSLGNPGGTPNQLVNVTEGSTTQCVTTSMEEPAFVAIANVSGDLEACAPWGITVSGGSPPYTITLAETGDPFVINATMPYGADRYTYINRATSGGLLIAGVSDSWGNWASRTPVVYPIGSSDNDCDGLESSSGNSTLIDQQDAQRNAADASARNKHDIIVIIIIVLLLVGGAGGSASWILRKRRQRMQEIVASTVPVQFYRMCEENTRGDIPQEGLGKAPAPGVWRVAAPTKQSMFGRDVEEPAFRKNIPVPLTQSLRPASGSLSRTPSAPPQLQRTRTTSSSVVHSTENPPPRYESWTLMMGRTATVGTTRSENDSEADVAFVEG